MAEVMHRLKCVLCAKETQPHAKIEPVISEYLTHIIEAHWKILQMAHDNPEILVLANRINQGK